MASVRAVPIPFRGGRVTDRPTDTARELRRRRGRRRSRDPPTAIFSQVNLRVGYFQAQLNPQTLSGKEEEEGRRKEPLWTEPRRSEWEEGGNG